MAGYTVAIHADRVGTHLVGETPPLTYATLVAAFGTPAQYEADHGGDGKVSTEWTFRGADGVFTVYDYKETALYDDGLPSVAAFRAGPAYRWHIGGRTNPGDFLTWLLARVNGREED